MRAVVGDQARGAQGPIREQHDWQTGADEQAGAPVVSVVIPCYNQAHFLGEAIENMLSQEKTSAVGRLTRPV